MKLSEKLKELRTQKGKTQKEIAAELGVGSQTYSEWECGKVPSYRYFCQLEYYYQTPLLDLVGKTENSQAIKELIIERAKTEKFVAIKETKFIIKSFCDQLDEALGNLETLMRRGQNNG